MTDNFLAPILFTIFGFIYAKSDGGDRDLYKYPEKFSNYTTLEEDKEKQENKKSFKKECYFLKVDCTGRKIIKYLVIFIFIIVLLLLVVLGIVQLGQEVCTYRI